MSTGELAGYYEDYVALMEVFCPKSTTHLTTKIDFEINPLNNSFFNDKCLTNAVNISDSDSSDIFYGQRIYVPIVFGLTFIVGIVGNGLVVFVITKQCSFKCVTNMYLLNLACADLVFLAICVPFTGMVYVLPSWPFGESMCKLLNYITAVTMATSIMTLTAMSIDRYYAVLKPVDSKRYRTPAITAVLLTGIWVVNLGSLVPLILVSQVITYYTQGELRLFCAEVFVNNTTRHAYTITVFLAYYFIPLTIISLFYALMAQTLWTSVSPSFLRDNMLRALSYRKKVAKMLFVIVMVFAGCGFPLNVMRLITEFASLQFSPIIYHIKIIAYCCAYMNSAMNPIIYAFMSQNFRKCFKDAFLGCRTLRAPQMRPFRDPEELPRSVTMGIRMNGNNHATSVTSNHNSSGVDTNA